MATMLEVEWNTRKSHDFKYHRAFYWHHLVDLA